VLTLQKDNSEIVSISTAKKSIDELLSKEWLLTNKRGSYASSTVIGCNTRRYHGLLIGSLNPPADRIMALANCLEMAIYDGKVFNLSTFEFNRKFSPEGFGCLRRFRKDIGVHFDYQLDGLKLTKSVYLQRNTDCVGLVYDFTTVQRPVNFILRPFIGLRDFHTLQKSYAHLSSAIFADGLLIRHDVPNSCELFLSCPAATFEEDKQWWFNFLYRIERERGQEFNEDLWTPGFFKKIIDSPTRIVFWASLSAPVVRDGFCERNTQYAIRDAQYDIDAVCEDLRQHQNTIFESAKTEDKKLKKLCLAADQFIVTRQPEPLTLDPQPESDNYEPRTTILAGFPWFADWGRDAFIALPGLLLLTGRFEQAKSVLTTFAQAADEGMIPNRFDDNSNTAYFNSIDASLWFINAAFQYLQATGDSETFTQKLLPVIHWIIESYHKGTRFDISADDDGLITAGNEETQLTWMDAKFEGVVFTPRYGKTVEINALWYNALMLVARFYQGSYPDKDGVTQLETQRDIDSAQHYKSMADKVADSFSRLFWNKSAGYLNDCILPDGSVDASLRPNQIFAVSLPFSPVSPQQAKSVVDIVQKYLLTPYGLRTLNTQDAHYKGTYTGPRQLRDGAYHQGTVWPYLIGPFVESYLKVNNFSRKSKRKAAEFIRPLMQHLTEDGCLGQLCEIFDGDNPHEPKGCSAQAWSIAELIRAYRLINS
jgi:predicted glycogen debranching enzyme